MFGRKLSRHSLRSKKKNAAGLGFESLEPKQMLTTLASVSVEHDKIDSVKETVTDTAPVATGPEFPIARIVAGTDPDAIIDPNVPTSAFTGVVSLSLNGSICSGTLISPTHVLTAAHCVADDSGNPKISASDISVRFNHDQQGAWVDVNSFTIHPDFTRGSDDLAIVELSETAPLGAAIYPISTDSFSQGEVVVLAGHGRTGTGVNGSNLSSDFFVKRTGRNVVAATYTEPSGFTHNGLDDEGSGAREEFFYDFDGGGTDTLGDGSSLGNNIEASQAEGDSGGSIFSWDDDGDGVVEQNELTLYGVLRGGFPGGAGALAENGGFGQVIVAQFANRYANWIGGIVETDLFGNQVFTNTIPITATITAGSLLTRSDADYYSFFAVAGESYTFETELRGLSDSVITLWDARSNITVPVVLGSDNNSGDGLASLLEWTATSTGEFIIEVDSTSNLSGDSGGYLLTVSESDSPTSPREIAVGSSELAAIFSPEDVDYFSFDAVLGQSYTIETEFIELSQASALSDSVLRLSLNGEVLEFNNDGGEGTASNIFWTANFSGSVIVEVDNFAFETGAYIVNVYEDDFANDPFQSDFLTQNFVIGSIQNSDDQDLFAFTADAGVSYQFTDFISASSFSVLDRFGNVLQNSGFFQIDYYDPFSPFTSELFFAPPTSDVYYLRVDPSFTGDYGIDINIFGDDHPNFPSTFSSDELTVGNIAAGVLNGSVDLDYFQFTPTVGETYEIRAGNAGLETETFSLQLFDAERNELSYEPNLNEDVATLRWTATEAGTYFISVGAEDSESGEYDLQIITRDSVRFEVGNLRSGLAADDDNDGTGYILYSEENLRTRFPDASLNSGSSDHLIVVYLDDDGWLFDNNGSFEFFTPRLTDRLLAEVDAFADTVTSLEGNLGQTAGIESGYSRGDLAFFANQFDNQTNTGEFQVTGSYFEVGGIAQVEVGNLGSGIGAVDDRQGTGYILYSEQNLFTRFSGTLIGDVNLDGSVTFLDIDPFISLLASNTYLDEADIDRDGDVDFLDIGSFISVLSESPVSSQPFSLGAEHLIAVFYENGQWFYDNNFGQFAFTPQPGDRLLAEIDFTNNTVTSLEGQTGVENEIPLGYAVGNLEFFAEQFAGQTNPGEFQVTGTFFDLEDSNPQVSVQVGAIGAGINAVDDRQGTGFILYSEQDLATRFEANPPFAFGADHLIAVFYENGQWFYDNSFGQFAFTPASGDRLLANVDFSNDTVQSLQGTSGFENGINSGYTDGDLVFLADRFINPSIVNDGEFFVLGSFFQVEPEPESADFGLAFDFDGREDFIQIGDRSELEFTDSFTIEARVNPDRVDPSLSDILDPSGIIVNKEGEYELAIWGDGSLRYAIANDDPGWVWINTGIIVPQDQWTHIAFSYDSGVIRAYANGELEYTFNGSGLIGDVAPNFNDFRIGGRQAFIDQFFDGGLDEIRVWNQVLTDAEIMSRHASPLQGGEVGLVAYYPFESSNPLQDASPNDLDGVFGDPIHWTFDGNRFTGPFA